MSCLQFCIEVDLTSSRIRVLDSLIDTAMGENVMEAVEEWLSEEVPETKVSFRPVAL